MARPMILIQHELLEKLYNERQLGVPLQKLIDNHSLPIKHPTLSKIIQHYDNWKQFANNSFKDGDKQANLSMANRIAASLFPEWLTTNMSLVLKQPSEWFYEGPFPLGKWSKRNEA